MSNKNKTREDLLREVKELRLRLEQAEQKGVSPRAAEDDSQALRNPTPAPAGMSPIALFEADVSGRVTYLSPYWTVLSGRPVEAGLGDRWLEAVHPEDRSAAAELWHCYLQKGSPHDFEHRFRSLTGEEKWVYSQVEPECDEEGNVVRHIGTFVDVTARRRVQDDLRKAREELEQRVRERTTELQALIWQLEAMNRDLQNEIEDRKRVELALQHEKTRYRALAEQIPAVIYTAEIATGQPVYVSPQIESSLGFTPEDWVAQAGYWGRQAHPEDRERVLDAWRAATVEGKPISLDYRLLDAEGRVRWIHDEARAVKEPDGRPHFYQGVMLDITERRQAEEALRESEERFRQLTEHINDVFWIQEIGNAALLYLSPAFETVWGWPRDRVMGNFKHFLEFIHPDDRERIGNTYRKILKLVPQGITFEAEYRIVRGDGSVRWLWTRAFPVANQHDEVYRMAGITEDITERKRTEEQLQRYNEELEALVRQRTERVRELERQRALMGQLAAAGRVAARVAHEINNPLAGIKNAFLLIKDAVPADHPYYGYVPRIQKEIDRIAGIVHQMFDLCRPSDGSEARVSATHLIQSTAAVLESAFEKRRIRLITDIDSECEGFLLPGNSVRQVLHNLIQNAIDVTPAGHTVQLTATLLPSKEIAIQVRDEGPGIPEDRLPFIFEPFYTTKDTHQASGLGLGLSICKTLVENVGGSISCETEVGRGSTFQVTFPSRDLAAGDPST